MITARQFDRVDEKIDKLDLKIETEIDALRAEMKIGFANAHRELKSETSEIRQDFTKIDNKLDIVIEKLDSVLELQST